MPVHGTGRDGTRAGGGHAARSMSGLGRRGTRGSEGAGIGRRVAEPLWSPWPGTHDLRRSTKSGTVSKSVAFCLASFARCAAIAAFCASTSASFEALYS